MRSIKEEMLYCVRRIDKYGNISAPYWANVHTEHPLLSDAVQIAEDNAHREDGKLIIVRQHTRTIEDIIRVFEHKEKVETLQIEAPQIDSTLPPGYTGDDKDVPF